VSGCRVARTYVLDCYVQGVSIEFQLYKCIVASFNVTWCSIMSGKLDLASPSSKNSDGAESGNATKKESGLNLDGTD
jgi:hypothetical protein